MDDRELVERVRRTVGERLNEAVGEAESDGTTVIAGENREDVGPQSDR